MQKTLEGFNYDKIPEGFYDQIVYTGSPIRRCWHLSKFERVIECLPKKNNLSILDVGCFAGTFLSLLPEERFSHQVGTDILDGQVNYANTRYGTSFRKFVYPGNQVNLAKIEGSFDCVTLIEVIEHLNTSQIQDLFSQVEKKLKPGGLFVVSTPNYTSTWPLLEILLNQISDVSYEEQHITRFNYFNIQRKLKEIYPAFDQVFKVTFKTTTHFLSPFLAPLSLNGARKIARMVPHRWWRFPFGNLVIIALERK